MRPQAGVDRLKPVPPMHAHDLPVVGQALSPNAIYFVRQTRRMVHYSCELLAGFCLGKLPRRGQTALR